MDEIGKVTERYPYLDQFIGTRFYQCFDASLTLEQIVDEYISVEGKPNAGVVLEQLRQFLHQQANNIDAAFDEFHPGVHPPGYGMTTQQWLEEIGRLFAAGLG